MRLLSTPGDDSHRSVQQLVNFGTVALARVLGNPTDELLTLRCECGARRCSATIKATGDEHQSSDCSLVMVDTEHASAVPGRLVSSNERFVKLRIGSPP